MFYQNEPELTELTCPISGRPLWNFGRDWNTLDGPTIFGTEDKEFLYEKWPRIRDFRLYVKVVNGKPYDAKFPYRIWIFELDAAINRFGGTCITAWKEYFEVYDELLPVPDPELETKAEAIKTRWQEEQAEMRRRQIENPVDFGLPKVISVTVCTKTILDDAKSVQPLSMPTNTLFYFDFKFNRKKKSMLPKWLWDIVNYEKGLEGRFVKYKAYKLFGVCIWTKKTFCMS